MDGPLLGVPIRVMLSVSSPSPLWSPTTPKTLMGMILSVILRLDRSYFKEINKTCAATQKLARSIHKCLKISYIGSLVISTF